jgi:L-seryl-tRNA(Ser) seleniumtransferase
MLYRDPQRARGEIPVLSMLDCDEQTLAARAGRLADAIGPETEIVRSTAKVGGGALPLLELEGPAVALRGPGRPEAIMRALRDGDPPVIARIHDGQVLMDPRTLTDAQIEATAAAAREALNATR